MTKDQVAVALQEVGTLLEVRGENPFKVNAYANADRATELADSIVAALRKVPGVTRVEACGSLRRRRETVGDLDILAAAAEPGPVMDAFAALPRVTQVTNRGDTLCSVLVAVGDRRG